MVSVSIGLPVYNGENFIAQAIESIQAQTFTDFELIISDNASTDSTEEICRTFAVSDDRIKYHRQKANIGAAPNFNYLVKVSKGAYLKWAAHDDIIAPEFLEKTVSILNERPETVLCTSQVTVIDQDGRHCDTYTGVEPQFFAETRPERFGHVIQFHKQRCYEIFGLIRSSALEDTALIGGYKNGDGVLLAQLALRGHFFQVPEPLFSPRRHAAQSQRIIHDSQAYDEWFDPQNVGKVNLPYWRILSEFLRVVRQEPLTFREKAACRTRIAKQYLTVWRLLRGDIRRSVWRKLRKQLPSNTKTQADNFSS